MASIESKGKIAQPAEKHSISDQHVTISLQTDAATEKENPGALVGAAGGLEVVLGKFEDNTRREAAARAFLAALLACDPRDRVPLLDLFAEAMRHGQPVPAFSGVMAEANLWADWASRAEHKAYCAACWARLRPEDQGAFRAFITQERTAA